MAQNPTRGGEGVIAIIAARNADRPVPPLAPEYLTQEIRVGLILFQCLATPLVTASCRELSMFLACG